MKTKEDFGDFITFLYKGGYLYILENILLELSASAIKVFGKVNKGRISHMFEFYYLIIIDFIV
jgi:hypothetical protein